VGLLFLLYLAVSVCYTYLGMKWLALPALPLAIFGGTLGVFLGFRNNSAYDRWWEARSLWGAIVNNARTFTRQVLTQLDDQRPANNPSTTAIASKELLVEMQIAYVHALRCHLRRQTPFPELETMLPADMVAHLRKQRNVPIAILLAKAKILREYFDQGRLDTIRWTNIDRTLTELCNVQGACERIKNTPLPRQYHHVPQMMISMYSVLLPLGLLDGLGMLTPIVAALVYFTFTSLETIGQEIENPFENTVHDTPMSSLTRSIEIDLRQQLTGQLLPAEIRPVDGYVY
jgi:putative membrane protein